ncbi:MAG TPA: DUF1566 domain-containing protein [Nannocystaceae bacterium]|nr:DUF1566 domain-containing protein [Nannocystaceae bacterium]
MSLLVGAAALLLDGPSAAAPKLPGATPTSTPRLPVKRFSVSGEVVRDNKTGLSWERAPSAVKREWGAARSACDGSTLGGFDDWRIPRVEELKTLFETTPPTTQLAADHPFTVTSEERWTSTGDPARRTAVLVANGNIFGHAVSDALAVWCVRGGSNTAYPGSNPRFTYVEGSSYKRALDGKTGVVWRLGPIAYNDWYGARRECRKEGPGWRLATRGEYESLIDPTAPGSPKLPVGHPFANTYAPAYDGVSRWSSTMTSTATAETMRLSDGAAATVAKTTGEVSGYCVQGDPGAQRFSLVDEGAAVVDAETMLVWARSPIAVKAPQETHAAACAAKDVAGATGWRLPTVKEYETIVEATQAGTPKVVSGHPFTEIPAGSYLPFWTSDPAGGPAFKTLDVATGQASGYSKNTPLHGWCVRSLVM